MIYTPMGVLLAIMPWNFPYWQVIRAPAAALSGGSVVVLKHAPPTTGWALALAGAARAAGLPDGALSVLVVSAERTGEVMPGVIGDDRIAAVTLTGSTRAGRKVAAAGRTLKKTVLELGGSDAFVVLADADLDAAAAWAARSRLQNTGQSCIAAKRVIVEEPAADAGFVAYLGTMTLPGLRQLAHEPRKYHWPLPCCAPAGRWPPGTVLGIRGATDPVTSPGAYRDHPEIRLWRSLWEPLLVVTAVGHGGWPGARGDELIAVLTAVEAGDQPGLHSFARGIRRDQHAVTAGLALTYNSGALEGKNCKIKHLKRLMYGRANFDLLRKMALLS